MRKPVNKKQKPVAARSAKAKRADQPRKSSVLSDADTVDDEADIVTELVLSDDDD